MHHYKTTAFALSHVVFLALLLLLLQVSKMYRFLLLLFLYLSTQSFIGQVYATGYHYSMTLDYSKVFCNGAVPRRIFGEITERWNPNDNHWSHLNFTSLADLCSAHGNPRGNMGGKVYTHLPLPLQLLAYIPSHPHPVPHVRHPIL